MGYFLLTILSAVLALVFALWALRLLTRGSWLLGWIRGTFGFFLLALVAAFGCVAWDIYSYRQIEGEANIGTISFKSLAPQQYSATFNDINGKTSVYELYGDQWQLDSRIIKWNSLLTRLGMNTGYRLERISGRYLLLDDEHNKERSVYEINHSPGGVDLWLWLNQSNNNTMIDARYGNSTFLPMVEGAQYQVSISPSGLLARPLNQAAQDAIEQWQ